MDYRSGSDKTMFELKKTGEKVDFKAYVALEMSNGKMCFDIRFSRSEDYGKWPYFAV